MVDSPITGLMVSLFSNSNVLYCICTSYMLKSTHEESRRCKTSQINRRTDAYLPSSYIVVIEKE